MKKAILFFATFLLFVPVASAQMRVEQYGTQYNGRERGYFYVVVGSPDPGIVDDDDKMDVLVPRFVRKDGGWVLLTWIGNRSEAENGSFSTAALPEWLLPDLVRKIPAGLQEKVDHFLLFPGGGAWIFLKNDCNRQCAEAVAGRVSVAHAQ